MNTLPTFTQPFAAYSDEYINTKYRHKDPDGRLFMLDKLTAPGSGTRGHPQYELMGVTRYWCYNREKMDRLVKEGRIVQPSPGAVPRYKRYLDEVPGVAIGDVWSDINAINSMAQERMGYPTQKPEVLLERIIRASSNEGDVVLDAYCGCGTTVAVSQKLKRQWIGMDITYQSISLIFKRLEETFGPDVVKTIKSDGVPRDVEAAEALALRKDDRTRKEFEKWAVLTYSHNRAVIHQKKGADKGIDGVEYFATGRNETEKMVFQVKSGDVKRNDIATLKGDMEREGASLATLITLREPTKPMRDEAAHSGIYQHALTGRTMNRIQIVTVREMLEQGRRLDLPLTTDVLKQAPKHQEKRQLGLLD